jgi:ribosome maturation protein SDO1
MTLQVAF